MKVIDFEKKGNLVRFYLGDDKCTDYCGDDWNDSPYEHNAGMVYSKYVTGYIDIAFPFDTLVLEPKDDWRNDGNSGYCKEDMKKCFVPCIIAVPKEVYGDSWDETFGHWVGADETQRIYFGDDVVELMNYIECLAYEVSKIWK